MQLLPKGGFAIGQLSMETLLVLLLFLIMLGVAYFAISNLGSAAQKSIGSSLSKNSFNEFSSKISEACTLGNGNVRIVDVKGEPAAVSSNGTSFSFSTRDFSAKADSPCEITVLQSQPSRQFTIKNANGKISVS